LKKLQIENFEINVNEAEKINIKWKGRCDFKDAASLLVPYLNNIIAHFKNSKKEFEISFLDLQYMNSASIMPILKFIRDLDLSSIKSIILYNKNSQWQKKSFEALKMVTSELKHIDIISK
jgi:hypothetical protein